MTEFSIQDVQDGLVQLIAADESKKNCKKTFFFKDSLCLPKRQNWQTPPKLITWKRKQKHKDFYSPQYEMKLYWECLTSKRKGRAMQKPEKRK